MRRFHAYLLSAGLLAAPAGALAQPSDPWFEISPSKPRLGVMVMTLSPELRAHFGSTDASGVLVARVEPGSPAARAGIAVGDMIVDVKGTKVDDAGDVLTALAGAGSDSKKPVPVRILRDRKPMSIDVTLQAETTSRSDRWPSMRWLREMFDLSAPTGSSALKET